jgi:hypothetical protein
MAKRPSIPWKGDLARPIRWNGPSAKRITPSVAIPEPSAEAQAENARLYERALLDVFAESNRKLERLKERFAIPPQTVKTRLFRARALLRREMERRIGPVFGDAFPFAGRRCERLTGSVLNRLGLS